MSTADAERAHATEQTPLLREADPAEAGPEGQEPDEISTKELVITLGSIWLGVFLAALGRLRRSEMIEYTLIKAHCRFNNCRDTVSTYLLLLQLLLTAIVAGHFVPDLKCRLSTSQRPIDRYILASLGVGVFQRLLRHRQLDLWLGEYPVGHHSGTRGCWGWRRWSHGHLNLRDLRFGASPEERHLAGHW